MPTPPSAEQVRTARASYNRCHRSPDFLRQFYDRFLASDPGIPGYFTQTRFEKQTKLLEHGILLLLSYARTLNPALLARITERHGPVGLNIPDRLYPMFLASFLATVQQFDPECDAGVLAAWEAALAPGVAFIRGST